MENKLQGEFEKNKIANRLAFDRVSLENGDVVEIYCDPTTDQVRRYYIKRGDDVVEFGDREQYEKVGDEVVLLIKHRLAESGIIVTDNEAKQIIRSSRDHDFKENGPEPKRYDC